MRSSLICGLLILAKSSQQVEFWAQTEGANGDCGVEDCTGHVGGVCGREPELNISWCCAVGGSCVDYARDCTTSFDQNSQFRCTGDLSVCCNTGYEWCLSIENSARFGCVAVLFDNPAGAGPVSLAPGSTSILSTKPTPSTTTLPVDTITVNPTVGLSSSEKISKLTPAASSSPLSSSSTSFTSPSSLSLFSSSSTSYTSSSASPTSSTVSSPSPSSSSISRGAIAGVAIGGVIALLAIIGGVYVLGRRHEQKKLGAIPTSTRYQDQVQAVNVDGGYESNLQYRDEIQGIEVSEQPGEQRLH